MLKKVIKKGKEGAELVFISVQICFQVWQLRRYGLL